MKVRLTTSAELNLRTIFDWIARDDPAAAAQIANGLRERAREVGRRPLAYPAHPLRPSLRKRTWRKQVILYRVTTEVEIVGFFHVRRDYLSVLQDL